MILIYDPTKRIQGEVSVCIPISSLSLMAQKGGEPDGKTQTVGLRGEDNSPQSSYKVVLCL